MTVESISEEVNNELADIYSKVNNYVLKNMNLEEPLGGLLDIEDLSKHLKISKLFTVLLMNYVNKEGGIGKYETEVH